jgi:hypothetical protein
MIRTVPRLLMTIAILLASIPCAFAETRTISWDPVTTYTDNTPIEAGKTVNYTAYWTTNPGLGSLVTIGTSLTTTSTTFDPTVQGMTRGGTVYFTAKAVLNTGEESSLSPAYAWVVPLVAPPTAVLTSIAVNGPSSVNEGGTGTYTATGTWDNGTTAVISPTWSENSTFATIGAGGVLTASPVTANQTVTVTATYGGRTGTRSVTIVDVPVAAPAAPKNIGITALTSSVSAPSVAEPSVLAPPAPEIYRLNWDPVTTTWDGTPIDPGRTVRYSAYWTDDPALSAGSLRQLASLISGTALDFDPTANQMGKNQVVYLAARAILDTGDQSLLSESLVWRAENAGPGAPARGKIIKK